ncbi:MAG: aminotransferase class I and II [Anaeromyxobacteraceae bacterium]
MRTVHATRYVTPLREGGSLPAIVEGDDDGLYVAKFRGAGQGEKALVAELIAGELARLAGLRVPELVLLALDPALGRNEPDYEIRQLLKASAGTNLGVDYLPGSVTFDPVAGPAPAPALASAVVALDAWVQNVDRTPRNTNLLLWHRQLWLIDHGAALHFHHAWDARKDTARSAYPLVKDHVLLPWATALPAAVAALRAKATRPAIAAVLAAVPDAWLSADGPDRAAYVEHLARRLEASDLWLEEAERARAALV